MDLDNCWCYLSATSSLRSCGLCLPMLCNFLACACAVGSFYLSVSPRSDFHRNYRPWSLFAFTMSLIPFGSSADIIDTKCILSVLERMWWCCLELLVLERIGWWFLKFFTIWENTCAAPLRSYHKCPTEMPRATKKQQNYLKNMSSHEDFFISFAFFFLLLLFCAVGSCLFLFNSNYSYWELELGCFMSSGMLVISYAPFKSMGNVKDLLLDFWNHVLFEIGIRVLSILLG